MEQAIKAVLAAFGLVYLATAIASPGWFLDRLSLNERYRRRDERWWIVWPLFSLTVGGVCLLVYQSLEPLFAWIPRRVGRIEDGEFFVHRDLVRMSLSFILGVLTANRIDANAETMVQGPEDDRAKHVLTGAIQEAAPSVPGLLKTAALHVSEGMGPSHLKVSRAAAARREATRKEILHDLRDWPQVGPIEK